jgi:HAMP domain-containing protein
MVAALLAVFLAAVVGIAFVGERLAAHALHRQAQQRLLAARDRAVLALRTHLEDRREALAGLAADPRTVMAFRRLRRATRELDTDVATAPRLMARRRALVRSHLRRYYADELARNALQLDSLMVPQRAAIWLQAAFFSRPEGASQASADESDRESLYEIENEIWQPIFESIVEQFDWQDVLLADIADGRVLYSVSKTPVFQTSLIEGPYSESGLGSLFRQLRTEQPGVARWVDFAPFVPAHGLPVSFVGIPIFDGGTRIGALLVQEPADRMDQILSAHGHWPAVGLGETGDLFVVGSDSRLRSGSRFFEQLRSMHPAVERLGTTVLTFEVKSVPEPEDTAKSSLRYVNHRNVPVFGAAKQMGIADLPWTVVAEIDEAEALASLGPLRESLGLVVLGLLLLGVIVTLTVVNWILRPMKHVLDTLRAVRSGDTAARVPVRTAGAFGALGEAVNELIEAHGEWVEQETAERQQRESEMHELVSVLKALAHGDVSREARVDGHLAGLADAVNAMRRSVGHLTDQLCVVPPRVAETAYAMQGVADQILQDTERQKGELGSASAAVADMLDWLHGCAVDGQGVVDAAARVEQIGGGLERAINRRSSNGGDSENHPSPLQELRRESSLDGHVSPTTARYQRLRATIDEGERLQGAVRNAVDVARRIRTAAEALRGHAQTLQLVALDLHAQGNAGNDPRLGDEPDSGVREDSGTTPPGGPRA